MTATLEQFGATALTKHELISSRLHFFDYLRSGLRLLPKRPLGVLSKVRSSEAPLCCSFTVLTNGDFAERGVVHLEVKYFSLLGRVLKPERQQDNHQLFADPTGQAVPQQCFFQPPRRAFWALATLERQTNERRIALQGSLKLTQYRAAPLSLDEALASRNGYELRRHLMLSQQKKDRTAAKRLLERLIFLAASSADRQTLRTISDIEAVLKAPAKSPNRHVETSLEPYVYLRPFMPAYQGMYPLSKWLASEAMMLEKAAGHAHIIVEDGPQAALRQLALRYAGFSQNTDEIWGADDVPWLNKSDIAFYLSKTEK